MGRSPLIRSKHNNINMLTIARCVPALHDAVECRRYFVLRAVPEPGRLDEAAAQRCRDLLVLAGDPRDEVRGGLFADRLADLLGLTRAPGAGPRRAPL